jgi:hypothetical protein
VRVSLGKKMEREKAEVRLTRGETPGRDEHEMVEAHGGRT